MIVGVYGVVWAKGRDLKKAKPPPTAQPSASRDVEMAGE